MYVRTRQVNLGPGTMRKCVVIIVVNWPFNGEVVVVEQLISSVCINMLVLALQCARTKIM